MITEITSFGSTSSYDRLFLQCLEKEVDGNLYLVTSGSRSHFAFRTKEGVQNWMSERGLRLSEELPNAGIAKNLSIIGGYRCCQYRNVEEFNALPAEHKCKVLDNAQFTLGKITEENGLKVIHSLLPCSDRIVFDYDHSYF